MTDSAEDDLRARLQRVRAFHGDNPAARDIETAKHVLQEDLGDFDLGYVEQRLPTYHLDDETRDRLIAHARRDAACAVFGMQTLSGEVARLRKTVRLLVGVLIVLVSVQTWTLVFG